MRPVFLAVLTLTLAACKGNGGDSGDTEDTDHTDTDTGPSDGSAVINEFVASNATGFTDETGAHPDWVEIANTGDTAIDLSGAALSDDPALPRKWLFPDGTELPASGYLVVACDGDPTVPQQLHASFSLSASGEDLGLYSADGDTWDELTFGVQTTDVSMARSPDRTGDFVADTTPTPGEANE